MVFTLWGNNGRKFFLLVFHSNVCCVECLVAEFVRILPLCHVDIPPFPAYSPPLARSQLIDFTILIAWRSSLKACCMDVLICWLWDHFFEKETMLMKRCLLWFVTRISGEGSDDSKAALCGCQTRGGTREGKTRDCHQNARSSAEVGRNTWEECSCTEG